MRFWRAFGLLAFVLLLRLFFLQAADLPKDAPKLFFDCSFCDEKTKNYIKEQIFLANHVTERQVAEVYVLVIKETMGGGGTKYTLEFEGQGKFAGMEKDSRSFEVGSQATDDEIRQKMVEQLKQGLFRFVDKTSLRKHLKVDFNKPEGIPVQKDPWKNWVFATKFDGSMGMQSSFKYLNLNAGVSVDRVTEDIKMGFGAQGSRFCSVYIIDDQKIVSGTHYASLKGHAIKSLGPRWSTGLWGSAEQDTYNNQRLSVTVAPGVEYNLFPYSQASKKQLRFVYQVGVKLAKYFEETVFGKTGEFLCGQSVSIVLDLTQKWGSTQAGIYGGNYLNHLKEGEVGCYGNIRWNLIKGLSLYLASNFRWTNDQRSITKRGLTPEEILLRTKNRVSQYNFSASAGLEFRFGSTNNNVINPRFGN